MSRIHRLTIAFAIVLLAGAVSGRAAQNRDEVALRAAIETETVKGDLKAAIAQFQKLSTSSDRTVAATALFHLAGCYERLGQADAQKVYAEVTEKFGDESAIAAQARQRMSAGKSSVAPRGLSEELVWSARDDRSYGA